jgi:catechol 2,3-dioxygenase-like lactoylglutathione lyase family enzyme
VINIDAAMLIDTHAHLDFPEFAEDLDHVLVRAKQASVERIITIGTTLQSSRKAIQLAERYPQIYASVGIHPNSASQERDNDGWTYWHSLRGTSMVEKISAVTLRVANMRASVRFYKDVLGLEIIYGSEGSYFTSLRTKDGDTILNLEHGNASIRWGRLIFHVSDVDRFWAYLMEKGFHPDSPQDASWGERYFHLPDPDGHELSFARPI